MLQYDNRIRRAAQISPLKLLFAEFVLDPPWRSAQFGELLFYREKRERNGKPKGEKRKKKIYEREKERRKLNIVCLRYVWKPKYARIYTCIACMRGSKVYAPTNQLQPVRCKLLGRKGDLCNLQHGTRFDKLNGLLRTRGDTTREWLRMAAKSMWYQGYRM